MNSPENSKIFIVEDNFMYSYILEEMLKEENNYKITTFSTGEGCVEMLQNNPDLIILDYNLEGAMNGMDTFKMISSMKPKIPVIILSSQTDVQIATDLLKMGAFDYIQKKDGETALLNLENSIFKALKRK